MIGNGQYLDITHISNTSISLSTIVLQILNVLVVPNIAKNLMSVSKLIHDNSLTIESNVFSCMLKDHLGTLLL